MASVRARAYRGSGGGAPSGGPGKQSPSGGQGRSQSPPKAESSAAFETPAEEPNLTLVKIINLLPAIMFISQKFGGVNSVVFGVAKFAAWGPPPSPLLSAPLFSLTDACDSEDRPICLTHIAAP